MRIEFELINKETINIIGIDANTKRNIIGKIFTPSGTGNDCVNAIQVCGFKNAFDLWGCGRFVYPKLKNDMEYEFNNGQMILQYAKDIQLMFDDETKIDESLSGDWAHNCPGCFNNPCTCERKDNYDNPYTVKREQDLKLLEKTNGDKLKTKLRMVEALKEK
jgi:hypothetical protein